MHGVATFYDDLLAPRGRRHVRVCTGTACFAATGGAHEHELQAGSGSLPASASADGSVSLAETVLPGLLPQRARGARRRRGRRGPRRRRARARRTPRASAEEPAARSLLPDPALTVPGDWSALPHVLARLDPEQLLEQVAEADLRGRGGAWFPAAQKWRFARAAPGERRYIVANGDEGDPGSYIDKHLMERSPALVLEGMALAGYAVGASRGRRARALGVPAVAPGARGGDRRGARRRAARRGHPGLRLLLRRARRRRRGVVCRGGGDGAARLPPRAARHGVGAAAVSRRARALRAPDRRPQHRDARERAGHRRARRRRPTATSAR